MKKLELFDKFSSHNRHRISDVELCLITQVRVDLLEGSNICSSAFKRGKYRREINVGAQTKQAVSFIIIPMRSGELPIGVKAAVKYSTMVDGVQKTLRVVVRDENLEAIFFFFLGLHLLPLTEIIIFFNF